MHFFAFNTFVCDVMCNEIHKTETPRGSRTGMLIVNVLFESKVDTPSHSDHFIILDRMVVSNVIQALRMMIVGGLYFNSNFTMVNKQ